MTDEATFAKAPMPEPVGHTAVDGPMPVNDPEPEISGTVHVGHPMSLAPAPAVTLLDLHERLTDLEAWAKTTPGMLYQAPPMASGAKVVAFYKSADGTFSKHVMEPIDYASAKAHDPKAWSLVAPELGSTVIDKTKGIPAG